MVEIRCPECQKRYRIDQSKLPASGRAVIRCVECGHKISLDVGGQSGEGPGVSPGDSGSSAADMDRQLERSGFAGDREVISNSEADILDSGKASAVVYCPDIQAQKEIEGKLMDLGFQIRFINDIDGLNHLMRFNQFQVAILYQTGHEPEDTLKSILGRFHALGPEIRRQILLLYIHLAGNISDRLSAFSRGVDYCLNPRDITEFHRIIPELQRNHELDYRVFEQVRKQVRETVI